MFMTLFWKSAVGKKNRKVKLGYELPKRFHTLVPITKKTFGNFLSESNAK